MAYPRTFSDLYTDAIARMRLDTTLDTQRAKDAINVAYSDVCITNEVLQSKATVTPASGGTYTLASAAVRIKAIQITTASVIYTPLRYRPLSEILRMRAAATASPANAPPSFYTFDGSATIEVYPNFIGNESMDVWAVNQPTALSADGDIPSALPEPYPQVILYGALVELADFTKDLITGMSGYNQSYQMWLMKLRAHLNRRRGMTSGSWDVGSSQTFIPKDPSTDIRHWG